MMPILLSFLSPEHSWATQTSAGDFLKAIITISANASQNEQSCIGPNELTRQLVSHDCVEQLISDMLKGGNPLTVGVGIVIEVIRKNNSDYDPDVSSEGSVPTSRDPIYLGTLLRLFAQHIPDFMDLILRSTHTVGSGDGPVTMRRKELKAAHGSSIEPLGFDRFKTCELMAELLHCSNMGLLNEIGSEEFIQSRNAERDRLRSIGTLGVSSDMANTTDEDLTMRTSTNTYPASAELSRKLEVQNASDDDFEEVTHSADLGDDSKDELIEKPDMDEQGNPTKPDTPLSFVEKDDVDDFVDEPLSSPRLRPFQTHLDDPEMQVMPLSPTKELSSKVGALDINKDVHLPPPPSMETITADPESSQTVSIASELEPAGISSEDPSGSDNPPNSQGAAALETLVPPTANDDEPAPLSVSKSTLPENGAPNDVPKAPESTTTDITDTDAGEVTASVLDDKFDEQSGKASPQAIDPVVGDYLKMQFVDHKVVPTILVSPQAPPRD